MARVTLQDIFQAGFPAYEQTHPLPWHVCQAGRAIMRCRTAVLRRASSRGALHLPEGIRPQAFRNLLNRLGHKKTTRWNVRIMERYSHGRGVATYLARYLRGGPITNSRLVSFDGQAVTFVSQQNHDTPEDGTGRRERMRLPVGDFLQRVLLHVPAPPTQVVRFYGLYHHSKAEALAVCRTQLGQSPVVIPVRLDWQTYCAQRGEAYPERCPTCGQLLVCSAIIPRGGAPPARQGGERAA